MLHLATHTHTYMPIAETAMHNVNLYIGNVLVTCSETLSLGQQEMGSTLQPLGLGTTPFPPVPPWDSTGAFRGKSEGFWEFLCDYVVGSHYSVYKKQYRQHHDLHDWYMTGM